MLVYQWLGKEKKAKENILANFFTVYCYIYISTELQ